MANEALEVVKLRQNFYRDNYRRLVVALLISLIVILALGALDAYLIINRPSPEYFATNGKGQIIPLTPLSKPNLSHEAVLDFVTKAAIASYTYNFVNYRQALQSASDYYTPSGWKEFLKALQSSNNMSAVKEKKLVVSAVATGAPVILQEGVLNGVYAWKIQLPVLVTYQSASDTIHQSLLVTGLVERIPVLNNPQGIGISQMVIESGG